MRVMVLLDGQHILTVFCRVLVYIKYRALSRNKLRTITKYNCIVDIF